MKYELKYDCMEYLEKSELPWIKYNLHSFNKNNDSCAEDLKSILLNNEFIKSLIDESLQWPNVPLKRHNDAKHIIHKICLLLDLGLNNKDTAMKEIADKILSNHSDDGAFLTMLNISKNYGGTGEDDLQWLVCDFPILLYIMIKLGLENDERVIKAISFLKSIVSDNGWRCVGAVEKFRGPGRKADYCPYGTLVSLKAFSLLPQYHNEDFIKNGIDSILNHWRNQKERKMYMFGIGTDFKKLKYPNIWFNIVHVVNVLSHFEYAVKSKELNEMISIIIDKQLSTGGFIPESIYTAFKGCDFGQKKIESETLTYTIFSIFERLKEVDYHK